MSKISKEYELFYFLPITFSPEEVNGTREKITSIISKYNGAITKEEDMGKKKLSYAVKGARHGYYLLTHFNSDTASANMISGEIKLIPEIIRHRLVIKQNYKQPHTSPMAPGVKEDQEEKITTNSETETKKEKEHDNGKVDIQELDRKIDELLLEDI